MRVGKAAIAVLALVGRCGCKRLVDDATQCKETMTLDGTKCKNGIHAFSDMEGDYTFLENWIDGLVLKEAITKTNVTGLNGSSSVWLAAGTNTKLLDENKWNYFKLELKPGHCIVNLGDMMDCGKQIDRTQGVFRGIATFLKLREAHPDRVKLLLGNRDLNKLRLPSELNGAENESFGGTPGPFVYHTKPGPLKDPTKSPLNSEKACRPPPGETSETLAGKRARWFKWMLTETMGAPKGLEGYKKELEGMVVSGVTLTDSQITEYVYHQTVTEGGLFFSYLKHAGIVALAESALFVHGNVAKCALDGDQFIVPGAADKNSVQFNMSLTAEQRAAQPVGWAGRERDVKQFVVKMHAFKQREFVDWKKNSFFKPHSELLIRGGNALIDSALGPPKGSNGGFTGCSIATAPAVQALDDATASELAKKGITHVLTGHIPQGAVPRTFVTNTPNGTLTIVNMDVTYAHPVFPACTPGDETHQRCIYAVSPLVTYLPTSRNVTIHGTIAASSENETEVVEYTNVGVQNEHATTWTGPGQNCTEHDRQDVAWMITGTASWGGFYVKQVKSMGVAAQEKTPKSSIGLWSGPKSGDGATQATRLFTTVKNYNVYVYLVPGI